MTKESYFKESSGLRTVHWLPCGTLPIAMSPFLLSAPLHKLGHKTCLIKGVRLVETFPNQSLCTCIQKFPILCNYVCLLKVFLASLCFTEFCWNSNKLFYFAFFMMSSDRNHKKKIYSGLNHSLNIYILNTGLQQLHSTLISMKNNLRADWLSFFYEIKLQVNIVMKCQL